MRSSTSKLSKKLNMLLCMERRHLQLFDSRVMAPKNIEYFYKDEYAALNENMTLKVKI